MKRPCLLTFGVATVALLLAQAVAFADSNCPPGTMYPEETMPRAATGERMRISLTPEEQNGITYVNGGIAEEKRVIDQMSPHYNMRLTMATACGRLDAAPLRIEDQQGKTVINAPDAGPMFLAKMPAGKYTLHIDPANGSSITRTVWIPSHGQAKVLLTIPDHSSSEPRHFADQP